MYGTNLEGRALDQLVALHQLLQRQLARLDLHLMLWRYVLGVELLMKIGQGGLSFEVGCICW